MFGLGLTALTALWKKQNAYCIAIPVGARIARMHFVQNFFLFNYCLWYVVSVKWSRTCMLSCPVSWTAKKPNWFYPGCYPDCFPALMMRDECVASNRFPSAWIRRRRRPPENLHSWPQLFNSWKFPVHSGLHFSNSCEFPEALLLGRSRPTPCWERVR